MKSNVKIILFYIALIAVVLIATGAILGGSHNDKIENYSEIYDLFQNKQIKEFEIDGDNKLTIKKSDDSVVSFNLRDYKFFMDQFGEIINAQHDEGIIVKYNIAEPVSIPWWVSFLPYVIVIILFIVFWFFIMNQFSGAGGKGKIANFGKARARMGTDEKKKVLFKDVAGADEEKAELEEVVDFLRDPSKFTKLGAHIPHGVLLVGPPGTGKTLLAKAVAGEAGVPFYSISGSDFVEMYVGVGASRVRDLFDTAKKNPASIVFIDEIDAVGRHRGAGLGGGHDEREQTLNQLLVEMDGFGANEGVIVMAATNRPDILDPALLRPGRFDRQITVGYPDIKGREEILKVHSAEKPLEKTVNLHTVAQETVGLTGADLANLMNEAALLAVRRKKSLIGTEDIEDALLKITVGTKKKSMVIKPEEKKKTAYHEAGHAIMAWALPHNDPVRMISIIPSGRALGFTLNPPTEDKYSVYRSGLKEEIAMLLGGRAAERIVFGDFSGGASNDIQRATQIARKMVTQLGMSDTLGPIVYGSGHSDDEVFLGRDFNSAVDYSDATARQIDEEIHALIDEAYALCEKTLTEYRNKLDFIAEFLVKNETMSAEQFKATMEGDADMETIEAIASEKKQKSEEENRDQEIRNEEDREREEAANRQSSDREQNPKPKD